MTIPHLPVGEYTVLLAEAWTHPAMMVSTASVNVSSRLLVDGAVDLQAVPLHHGWNVTAPGVSGVLAQVRCKQFFTALRKGVTREPEPFPAYAVEHGDTDGGAFVEFLGHCMERPFPWRGARARVIVTERRSTKRPDVSALFEEWQPVYQDGPDIARGRVHLAPLTREAEACAAECKALDPNVPEAEQRAWMLLFTELLDIRDHYGSPYR